MNTKLHSASSEFGYVRVASYIYISTVIKEMSKILRLKYLGGSEKKNRYKCMEAAEN
jgi:hypothetical protein